MEVMRASRRRFSSFSTMNSRLRTSSAVMAASLSASARRFCSSTCASNSTTELMQPTLVNQHCYGSPGMSWMSCQDDCGMPQLLLLNLAHPHQTWV